MSIVMNKSITVLFAIIGIYWIVSSLTQQGAPLLFIPGILSLIVACSQLPITSTKINKYTKKLFLPVLLYNLVLTSYQVYFSFFALSSRIIGIELGIFILNLIFTLSLIYLLLQTLRRARIDIS